MIVPPTGLSGLGSLGGIGGSGGSIMPQPSSTDGASGTGFGAMLKDMVVTKPSEAQASSDKMAAKFAAGDKSIDPAQLAISSAKAGVDVQMATRTISQAVSGVKMLFQMQI